MEVRSRNIRKAYRIMEEMKDTFKHTPRIKEILFLDRYIKALEGECMIDRGPPIRKK